MSDKTYNTLKWIALTGLPALTTFYGVVGTTFHIPYTQEVLTVAVAFDTMLGTMLGISSANYQKGIDEELLIFPIDDKEDIDDGK